MSNEKDNVQNDYDYSRETLYELIEKGITFRHLFRDKNNRMISVVDIEKNRCDYFKALSQ